MPKSVDEIIGSLGEEEKEVLNSHIFTSVEAEKTKGIKSYQEAKKEVDRVLNKYKPLERVAQAIQEAGLDPADENLAEAIKSAKKAGEGRSELEKTVAMSAKQIKALSDQLAEKDRINAEKDAKIARKTIVEKLSKAFENKLLDGVSEHVISSMLLGNKVKLADDNETAVFVSDGEEISFDKGIEAWMKVNKSLLKNTQKSGGGSSGGSGVKDKNLDRPTMSEAEYLKLPPKEMAIFSLPKDKGGQGGIVV